MAIDTNAEKLAILEWDEVYEPAIPLSPGATFEQGEKQNLIWGFPGVLWGEPVPEEAPTPVVGGGRSKRRRRRIVVGKRHYLVDSDEEERRIVEAYIAELNAEREKGRIRPKVVQRRLKLARTRLDKLAVEQRRRAEEELLMLLAA